MNIYDVTNVRSPIKSNIEYTGEIALLSAYFMPRWYKPQTKVLFSWESNGKNLRNYIPIINGKTYTFQDMVNLLKTHLQDAYKFLIYNNDRVSLILENNKGIDKVMFCSELLDKYKLPRLDNYCTGKAIQGDEILDNDLSITFNDTRLVFFKCNELDDTVNHQNTRGSKTLAIIPLNTPENQIIDGRSYISHEFRNIIYKALDKFNTNYQLTFSACDEEGNLLPLHQHAFTVLNKQ